MQVPFPRVRLHEFHEFRVRSPVQGGLIDESVDRLLTEPMTPSLQRWLGNTEHIAFAPSATHVNTALSNGSHMIGVYYSLLVISRREAAQLAYGGGSS